MKISIFPAARNKYRWIISVLLAAFGVGFIGLNSKYIYAEARVITDGSQEECLISSTENSDTIHSTIPANHRGKLVYSYDGTLYTVDLETKQVQHFVGVKGMVAPDWYPYGRLIAFGRGNIFLLDTKTAEILPLTNSSITLWDPSWSPDGKKLVYMQMAGERGLYVIDMSNDQQEQLNIGFWNPVHPAWSPDGKQIAFAVEDETGLNQIYSVEIDTCSDSNTCKVTQLTNDVRGQSFEPAWSPDGKQIAFTSQRDRFLAIYTMSVDGSNQHRVTDNELWDTDPTWSPDGKYIAFTRWGRSEGDRLITQNIYVMRPDGSDITCITSGGGVEPDWWMEETADESTLDLVLDNQDRRYSPEYSSSPIAGKLFHNGLSTFS
jgi:TolB protein